MATSGTYDFTINRDDIIREASDIVGSYSNNEALPAYEVTGCARKLNLIVKAWMAQGIHLWTLDNATLFLDIGTPSYLLGPTGANCTNNYVHTTLNTGSLSGATTLDVVSATGMSIDDYIGIVLDSGDLFWTTISALGSPITITDALPGDASATNVVFAYTTKIQRPLRIHSAYWRDINNNDIPLRVMSQLDYDELSVKFNTGKPIQLYYDPKLNEGVLSVWPTGDIPTDVIRFRYERPLQDFDILTNNPDFPIEWGDALIYALAVRMAPTWGLTLPERQLLKAEADEKLENALGFDRENTGIFMQPDLYP